ncbi:MAG TPA: Gfo/Idh/MocA family oxidoreductase [Verrucomicrobiae bacterium]|nr:Gfo/Idh/MocA family oxidoreductase [Verrucomicrobiae bacterium]
MTNIYRVGIVGSGFGVRSHLPALTAHPRFEVVALASPNSAARVAAERNIAQSFASAAQMIAGAKLDAIVVASPPFTHRDDVLAALDGGLHVLCEKPFALNVAQAQEMVDAAKRAGTACGMSHEFRWIPERIALKQMIDNGHLAPLREIEITQLAGWLRADGTRKRGWWFDRARGGGIGGALLSHLIDTATWLAGRAPQRSNGFLRTANARRTDPEGAFESTADDGAFAIVDYGDGLIARLACDATCAVDQFTLAIHAENRTAVASGASMHELRLFAVGTEETDELECKPSPYARFAAVDPHVPYLMELYDQWVAQIETGKSALPTFEDALVTQRVLASIGYGAD